eukprot:CAMPEP_0176475650 /NCGR_PEP_ID=MMETSP0127-20121128/43720_1 /TAXON_ID=938130 /ORGANISM="Platyophrya macrostoma, Strain WH" /LENGTH=113 /DNA_ID=CAMNT_0017871261 /DNA_START=483 /DNA_END=821 /DNA_ORIENTATION=-
MIYKHNGNNQVEIVTGWTDQGAREFNQEIVPPARFDLDGRHPCAGPPARFDLDGRHPCAGLNRTLLECSVRCPSEMRLAGRCASCNDERHELMKCLTKQKRWVPPAEDAKPWW